MKVRTGFILLTSIMLVIAIGGCITPYALFYASCGRLPLSRSQDPFSIEPGTTTDKVREKLGEPHSRSVKADGSEVWDYHGDLFGFVIYCMEFDREGRLRNTWW